MDKVRKIGIEVKPLQNALRVCYRPADSFASQLPALPRLKIGGLRESSFVFPGQVDRILFEFTPGDFRSVQPVTAMREEQIHPSHYVLSQNYPNPFNPQTRIEYMLPQESHVTLTLSNVLGEEVLTLVDGMQSAGTQSVIVDARNLPSGAYFYTLKAGSYGDVKRMILLR